MNIGITQGERLKADWIKAGMSEEEAENRLSFLRGAEVEYVGRTYRMDDLGNTYRN